MAHGQKAHEPSLGSLAIPRELGSARAAPTPDIKHITKFALDNYCRFLIMDQMIQIYRPLRMLVYRAIALLFFIGSWVVQLKQLH